MIISSNDFFLVQYMIFIIALTNFLLSIKIQIAKYLKKMQCADSSICLFSFPSQEVFKSHFIVARDGHKLFSNEKHVVHLNVAYVDYRLFFIIDNSRK